LPTPASRRSFSAGALPLWGALSGAFASVLSLKVPEPC
jgi:hypothetical protein